MSPRGLGIAAAVARAVAEGDGNGWRDQHVYTLGGRGAYRVITSMLVADLNDARVMRERVIGAPWFVPGPDDIFQIEGAVFSGKAKP